ncbi:MAG TPA: hypothetical protein VE008_07425 [Burkholderiales bacterium]|nr:hypothetical protein [Burkholderiales bacterium]
MDAVTLLKGLQIISALNQAALLTSSALQTVSDMMVKAHSENRPFTAEENAVLDKMVDDALADNQKAIDEAKAAGRT